MIAPELLAEARNLALRAAPELAQAGFYIVQSEEHPQPQGSLAVCYPTANAWLRQLLSDAGQWVGQGTAIVLSGDVPDDREEVLGIVLHETAHALPFRPPPPDAEPTLAL